MGNMARGSGTLLAARTSCAQLAVITNLERTGNGPSSGVFLRLPVARGDGNDSFDCATVIECCARCWVSARASSFSFPQVDVW